MTHTKISAKSVSVIGILAAVEILLSHFSIHTWNLKIGFSFLPVAAAAVLYGSVAGGLVAAIGDIAGAFLFPAGMYFPGFTLTAFLSGALFGWFFRRRVTVANTVCAVFAIQWVISQICNTYLISFLYGSPYVPLFLTRLPQTAAMCAIQILCILLMEKKLFPVLRRYEWDNL